MPKTNEEAIGIIPGWLNLLSSTITNKKTNTALLNSRK